MNLLVIGGTVFLGRHIVEYALKIGHNITLFNRGQHNPDLFPEVEKIHGDRKTDYDKLKDRNWDAVIDTCGYLPGDISKMASILKVNVNKYVFVSSISAYNNFKEAGIDESYDLAELPTDSSPDEFKIENYGALKALCEREVIKNFPDNYVNARSGLIVGPNDPTDRFSYWVNRINSGGKVLAPGNGKSPVQFIDVRDLAGWLVRMAENGKSGDYNATGPEKTLTIRELLEECCNICNMDTELVWVDEKFIEENEIQPWSELPVWVPDSNPDYNGFSKVSINKAIQQGLTYTKLSETILSTLDYINKFPRNYDLKAGLKSDHEATLLNTFLSKAI